MVFLFWNVKRRPIQQLIGQLARDEKVDVIVLAESALEWSDLSPALNSGEGAAYRPPAVLGEKGNKLTFITRLPDNAVKPVSDKTGISFRQIVPPVGVDVLLGVAHLPSKLHQQDDDQKFLSVTINNYIAEAEAKVAHSRTVVVGDFNMNPFEPGMVAANGLHSVMSRKVASDVSRQVSGVEHFFFYNPMWRHFGGTATSPHGTYFFKSSKHVCYFWNIFDQVMVRPALLHHLDDTDVRIVTTIGGTSLLDASGIPDDTVASDHLPLLFTLNIERTL